jgi:hypothetical protein
MSKFLGKFRKEQNYSDDFLSVKQSGMKLRKRNEHHEIKNLLKNIEDEHFNNTKNEITIN